jgi:hypothetical protein
MCKAILGETDKALLDNNLSRSQIWIARRLFGLVSRVVMERCNGGSVRRARAMYAPDPEDGSVSFLNTDFTDWTDFPSRDSPLLRAVARSVQAV